jgi:hypothetical protein
MKAPEPITTKPAEQPKAMPSPEKKSELNPAPRLVPAPQPSLTVDSDLKNPF